MWPRKQDPELPPEPVLDHETLNGIIELLMRIDANVQSLLYGEEDDDEERD